MVQQPRSMEEHSLHFGASEVWSDVEICSPACVLYHAVTQLSVIGNRRPQASRCKQQGHAATSPTASLRVKWLHASLIQGPNHAVSFLPPFSSTIYRLALLLVIKRLPPCQASHPDAATALRRRTDLALWRWLSPVDLYFRARNDFVQIPQQNFLQVP